MAEASTPAPFIYVDIVPNFGFNVVVLVLELLQSAHLRASHRLPPP
jgi:hypothetical protein